MSGNLSIELKLPDHYINYFEATSGCEFGLMTLLIGKFSSIRARVASDEVTLVRISPQFFSKNWLSPKFLAGCVQLLLKKYTEMVLTVDNSFEWMHIHGGDTLVSVGDSCESIFTVISGRLRAIQEHSYKHKAVKTVNEFGRGATIGALDMLASSRSVTSVYAIRDSQIARMPRNIFDLIVHKYPQVLLHFTRLIATKIPRGVSNTHASTDKCLTSFNSSTDISGSKAPALSIGTIGVIAGSAHAPLRDFCLHFTSALKTVAETALVTSTKARDALGQNWQSQSRLSQSNLSSWLGDIENDHPLVLYEADHQLTPWTQLCIRQVDHILIVCNDGEELSTEKFEEALRDSSKKKKIQISLVRIRQSFFTGVKSKLGKNITSLFSQPQTDVHRWITRFHNIRFPFMDYAGDLERLARRCTGQSVGLVLGGGGARGLAHIGVLKALKDCNVQLDVVGGTSIGAFIGGLYALHPDNIETVTSKCRMISGKLANVFEKLLDLTLPVSSFFNGSRFNSSLKDVFLDAKIEDMPLNYYCVSTDVAKSKLRIHRSGEMWKYIRASMSLQGYLPPISENGSLLLDGGYINNLPADVMREEHANIVIAVDVGAPSTTGYFGYGDSLSGWWVLWNKLNPFQKTALVPSMGDVSVALAYVSSEQTLERVKQNSIDLYLRPPVAKYGTLEFDKMDEIIQVGYDYALPRIQEFLRKQEVSLQEN